MYTIFANRSCPYVQRVMLAAACRRIPEWQLRFQWIEFENPPEELVGLNPDWTVPTLVGAPGEWFDDSLSIMEFIDAIPAPGKHLFGRTPMEQAMTRRRTQTLARDFVRPLRRLLASFGNRFEHPQRESAFRRGCTVLESTLHETSGPFLGGHEWDASDVALAPFIHQLLAAREMDPQFPIPQLRGPLMTYFMDLDRHPLTQNHCPPLRETMASMARWLLPPPEVAAIRDASPTLLAEPSARIRELNDSLRDEARLSSQQPVHWELKHDGLGVSMHAHFRTESSFQAIQLARTVAALEETVDHPCGARLDGFHTLHVALSTHHPQHGISEKDLAFAQCLASFFERKRAYGDEPLSPFD